MKIDLKPSQTYVAAVSGGVDSVVLLDLLAKQASGSRLIVAHFDHGVRPGSDEDARFVERLAADYGLVFVGRRADLGAGASEAVCRRARYDFLYQAVADFKAHALVTAHHLDDFLETVVLNFQRGGRRRGLAGPQSSEQLFRPLLRVPKADIVGYAEAQRLAWREDPTNLDLSYRRNYVRHHVMPKFSDEQKRRLLVICDELAAANRRLDDFLDNYLRYKSYRREGRVFSREWFNALADDQAAEVVNAWLLRHRVADRTSSQIRYIVVKLKTLNPGKVIVVDPEKNIRLTKRSLRLEF
ncbi:tRNA lysidine(34) synthetase TilS [Candidatus Saccharibacteria bacterium]|nr:tRNA lysidine(34) synthetase TilS [Candidatus Saccharibacteria bacterium]